MFSRKLNRLSIICVFCIFSMSISDGRADTLRGSIESSYNQSQGNIETSTLFARLKTSYADDSWLHSLNYDFDHQEIDSKKVFITSDIQLKTEFAFWGDLAMFGSVRSFYSTNQKIDQGDIGILGMGYPLIQDPFEILKIYLGAGYATVNYNPDVLSATEHKFSSTVSHFSLEYLYRLTPYFTFVDNLLIESYDNQHTKNEASLQFFLVNDNSASLNFSHLYYHFEKSLSFLKNEDTLFRLSLAYHF